MAISGGIKFFTPSKCKLEDGATIVAGTGDDTSDYAIDENPLTYWRSVGSDDTTTETVTVTFASATIDRLFLRDIHLKDFNVQYWDGAAFQHFASVVGLDGSKANITETAFADDTAYYEFTPVTTTKIRVQALKTQVANAEKYINEIIVCEELGTLAGFPLVKSLYQSRNEVEKRMLSGKVLVVKGDDSFGCKLDFKNYPPTSTYTPDFDLMMDLFDRDDPFLVWLCGGRRSTTYFRYALRGFRLRDVYQSQITADFKMSYLKGCYNSLLDLEVELKQHV